MESFAEVPVDGIEVGARVILDGLQFICCERGVWYELQPASLSDALLTRIHANSYLSKPGFRSGIWPTRNGDIDFVTQGKTGISYGLLPNLSQGFQTSMPVGLMRPSAIATGGRQCLVELPDRHHPIATCLSF